MTGRGVRASAEVFGEEEKGVRDDAKGINGRGIIRRHRLEHAGDQGQEQAHHRFNSPTVTGLICAPVNTDTPGR